MHIICIIYIMQICDIIVKDVARFLHSSSWFMCPELCGQSSKYWRYLHDRSTDHVDWRKEEPFPDTLHVVNLFLWTIMNYIFLFWTARFQYPLTKEQTVLLSEVHAGKELIQHPWEPLSNPKDGITLISGQLRQKPPPRPNCKFGRSTYL